MNNLHRELAPISDAAWAQIEEEASRTLKRYLAGRRVVDVHAQRHPLEVQQPLERRHVARDVRHAPDGAWSTCMRRAAPGFPPSAPVTCERYKRRRTASSRASAR